MNPNDIVGTPREYDVWLAPDWSNWSEKTKQSGWTRVSVRETLYANGRKVTEVLDENRQPITTRNLEETIDKDQERRFKDAEAAAAPPGGQATRTINGQVMQWNPQTRAYDIPTSQTPANDANARNAAELQRQREKNAALPPDQDPAYETDEERRKRAEARIKEQKADAERNKPGAPTLKPDGKGGTIAVQTMPDGTIKTTPLPDVPSDKPAPERVTVNGVVYERGSDGTYKPAAGIPAPTRGGKLPPGVKPPQFTRGNVATELTRFNQELDAAVSRGEISKEDATGFYTSYHNAAQTYLQEQNYSDSQDQGAANAQLTQRSQNMTQAGNRLNWANSAFQNAANADQQMLLGAAGTGRSALVPLLTLQAGLAHATGGFRNQPEVEVRRYPASIQPVAAATNTAATATGAKPGTIFTPKPPVSPAQAAAIAAQGRATAAGGAPTAGEPGGPPLATPPVTASPGAVTPRIRFRNVKTGEVREMAPMELDAQPDVADWQPDQGGGVGTGAAGVTVTPELSTPANGLPSGMPLPPNGTLPGAAPMPPQNQIPVDVPYPTNDGAMSKSMPKSIQPAMPSMQPPDIESKLAQMLADGADPMDVMEIRRRWRSGAAA